ncbi:MAG: glycosyltransferase family 4 protein [Sulfolobales archaeon]|nr:glycosyltransferase family 4 protein [Sulfolobales archaeon]
MVTVGLISSGLVPVPPKRGGAVELYVYKLCEALRNLGIRSYVIDRTWPNRGEHRNIIRVKIGGVTDSEILSYILGRSKHNIIREMVFGFKVAGIAKEFEVVHANTAWAGYVLSNLINRKRIKIIYTCHNGLWLEERVHLSERIVRLAEGSAMRKADAVIALNKTMKRAIVEKAYVSPSKVFVVPNGVDVEFFRPGLRCDEVYNEFNLWGKHVVLFVGRVTHSKGVHVLLKAAKILREKYKLKDIKIVIVGPLSGFFGDEEPTDYVLKLRDYVARNSLDVMFTGSLSHERLRYLYSCSHVFVLPSLFEAFGMVLIEAMASGLPVIGSRSGGIVDIIYEGVNGYLFEKNNSESLSKKLFIILTDKELRKRMSLNSRNIAVERYSWESVAKKIYEVYRKILVSL